MVERKHRYLLDTARVLRLQGNTLKKFWSEYIPTTTYLINRMSIASFNWQSPYEKLFKRISDYTHLSKFGHLCFATKINPHKDKFEPRFVRAVMIGYTGTHKAYKLYDLQINNTLISRDVIFCESIFPYAHNTDLNSSSVILIAIPKPDVIDKVITPSVPTSIPN